ncbi:MAG TPA: hypothetical protein VG796_17595 [Verrucomicrobiales bacterium]|jgi:hypothetical protein|nr:hypothetical protein [Verrucomicrobiales bacterium]
MKAYKKPLTLAVLAVSLLSGCESSSDHDAKMFRFANGRDETQQEKEQRWAEAAHRRWVEDGMKQPEEHRVTHW